MVLLMGKIIIEQRHFDIRTFILFCQDAILTSTHTLQGVKLTGRCLTMRAADKWDSARFTGFFVAWSFSRLSSLVHPPPTCG
jgi:hypothetical protein